MTRPNALVRTAVGCAVALSLTACGASSPPSASETSVPARTPSSTPSSTPTVSHASRTLPSTTSSATWVSASRTAAVSSAPGSTVPRGAADRSTAAPTTSAPSGAPSGAPSAASSHANSAAAAPGAGGAHPVIVIDPGHSPSVHHIDRRTGLDVSDYENEPEMRDVYKVALLVRSALQKAGYRVVMTKKSVDARVNLGKRAHIANRVHAALAISIHDQAGSNGGIGFRQGNNTVYYQSVGTYRETPGGTKVYFRDKHLAEVSKKFGAIFRRQRVNAQHVHVNLQGTVGYNLGSRGLAAGNIWLVQLLSKVPWIYNEAGGNSAGRVGLDSADRRTYARGLVAGVEHSVPLPKH